MVSELCKFESDLLCSPSPNGLERTIRKFPLLSRNYIINENEESKGEIITGNCTTGNSTDDTMQNLSPLINFNFPQPPPLSEIRRRYAEEENGDRVRQGKIYYPIPK